MVYLDYNATTPLADEVIEAITHSLKESWGNPSSAHIAGVKAKSVIDQARKDVAAMIYAEPSDIIFTSGGTEGNNWILRMALNHFHMCNNFDQKEVKPHFITTNVEHDSIKLVLEQFRDQGLADVTFVEVKSNGAVLVQDVVNAVRLNTVMVTIMLANNETGVIQPVAEISRAIRSLTSQKAAAQRILIHTDAAQAIGKIPVDVTALGVDYLTIVGHKFYAPRIGAVYARSPGQDSPMYPLFYGGGQERNFRPGTENTPMIAGLGKAAELVVTKLAEYHVCMKKNRDYLETSLQNIFGDGIVINGLSRDTERLPNTCNVSFVGGNLKGHEILSKAPSLQASVGAACHSQDRPSHILLAMGVSPEAAWKAVRISVGRETTQKEIDTVISELCAVFQR